MNKLLKGSIAGAAGIALLLGGAGTFALWNDSAAASGGTVQSGALTVVAKDAVGWKDISEGQPASEWRAVDSGTVGQTGYIAADKLVPGDTVTYTQKFDITATGKNLKATLAFNKSTVTIHPDLLQIVSPTNPAVKTDAVTVEMAAVKLPTGGTNGTGSATILKDALLPNTYNVTANTGGTITVEVVFTVKFDKNVPINKVGQGVDAVKMSTPGLTLTQVRS